MIKHSTERLFVLIHLSEPLKIVIGLIFGLPTCCRKPRMRCLLSGILIGASIFLGAIARAEDSADGDYTEDERSHWSLQPRSQSEIPQFTKPADRRWVRNPVDAFVLRRLNEDGLQPARQADRRTLVRRLYYDLLGLPPTPKQVDRFLADDSPDAYGKVVERLLASPQYGERWGQHWLDVVRYAETEGFEYDRHRAGAWRYRDWVVRSFNADKPYDRFVLEQLAGDEISGAGREEQIAVGFHRLGPVRRNAGNTDVAFSRNEVLTERTNAVGLAFLGLTLGCARCHDHMFDPIRQKDYYQLQAFLADTREHDILLADEEQAKQWKEKNDKVNVGIKKLRAKIANALGLEREKLVAQLKKLQDQISAPLPTISSIKREEPSPIFVLERGSTYKKQEQVSPRFLGVLHIDRKKNPTTEAAKSRTMLARWITDPENPLTARVMANRVWHYHFDRGLVDTPNDFGLNGNAPSHPLLLDFLAGELIRGDWQIKSLHRLILTSSTYRLASHDASNKNAKREDSENRLLWRFNRRRQSAEQLRDSMLAISGRLNGKMEGRSIIPPVEQELIDLLYKPSQWQVTADASQHDRRSIYLIAKRNLRVPFLEVFDQPDLLTSCPRRQSSTHAPQALELLNGPLANSLAEALTDRLLAEAGTDATKQINLAFRLTTGRLPTAKEKQLATAFIKQHPLKEFALAMFNLNAFLYVE